MGTWWQWNQPEQEKLRHRCNRGSPDRELSGVLGGRRWSKMAECWLERSRVRSPDRWTEEWWRSSSYVDLGSLSPKGLPPRLLGHQPLEGYGRTWGLKLETKVEIQLLENEVQAQWSLKQDWPDAIQPGLKTWNSLILPWQRGLPALETRLR